MDPVLIAKITSSPSLVWVFGAIGFHITNVFLGVYMAFQGKGPRLLRIHRLLFYSVVACLVSFLVMNQIHGANTIWEYLIGVYFITVIPLSKRWDVLLHALLSVVGLTFLPALILLQLF